MSPASKNAEQTPLLSSCILRTMFQSEHAITEDSLLPRSFNKLRQLGAKTGRFDDDLFCLCHSPCQLIPKCADAGRGVLPRPRPTKRSGTTFVFSGISAAFPSNSAAFPLISAAFPPISDANRGWNKLKNAKQLAAMG